MAKLICQVLGGGLPELTIDITINIDLYCYIYSADNLTFTALRLWLCQLLEMDTQYNIIDCRNIMLCNY